MNVNDLTTLIGTLGFPIVACVALFWRLQVEQESHKAETEKLTQAITELQNALVELSTYMKAVIKP